MNPFVGRLAVLPALVLGAAGVMAPATARAQGMPPGPPAAAPPAAASPAAGQVPAAPPPAGEMPPAYAPPPGYQPPPQSAPPGYGYPPPGYGAPPLGYPPPGYGYPPPVVYAPPPNIHDGFYLRMHVGGGYLQLASDGMSFSGPGLSLGVAVGGTIAPNLIIYGTGFGMTVADPRVHFAGGGEATYTGLNLALIGVGGGLAYYMANNFYLAGTLAAMQWSLSNAENSDYTLSESKTGLGFQGLLGKEWWVSEDWGLGVAGEVMAATMKDDVDVTWTALTFGLLFSATYN